MPSSMKSLSSALLPHLEAENDTTGFGRGDSSKEMCTRKIKKVANVAIVFLLYMFSGF